MIHSFYFRFLIITHCAWLSAFLAKLAYMLFVAKCFFEGLCQRKHIVNGNAEEAMRKIAMVHPAPARKVKIAQMDVNLNVDLSIIVPVYNYADLIRNNIESILSQKTMYNYELILVDDGSTDGAREIVCSYIKDSRVKVICQKNQGIAGARNTGLNHACGRYIMFVDCDDIVTDDIVETLMSKAYAEQCDIVMCAHDLVKERDGNITSIIPNVYSGRNLFGYSKDATILNYAGLPWCKVYKRELWNDVRFFQGYWYEDTIIHALLFTQCKKFAYVPKVCYKYRWYEKNFSHIQGKRSEPKCVDRYWIMLPILEKAEELKITGSDCFYTMLLNHLCGCYYNTIHGLGEDVIEALFILACDLFQKYRPSQKVKLPYILRMAERALDEGDINLWKLVAKYQ